MLHVKKKYTIVVLFTILNLNTNSYLPHIWLEEAGLSFHIHQTTPNSHNQIAVQNPQRHPVINSLEENRFT